MQYRGWEFGCLEVDDSLILSGSAERTGARFKFEVDLVRFDCDPYDALDVYENGIPNVEAQRVLCGFVNDNLLGAALSAIGSARDRLNVFIADELSRGWDSRGTHWGAESDMIRLSKKEPVCLTR